MLTNCPAACAHLSITVSEIERDIYEKIVILLYPFGIEKLEWCRATDGEKISKICLFVLT